MQPVSLVSSLRVCPDCGFITTLPSPINGFDRCCARCGKVLSHATQHPMSWTLACAITGYLFYGIVVSSPILEVTVYGRSRSSTMMTGIEFLGDQGLWILASIVLLTTILVPLLKLTALLTVFSALHIRYPPRWIIPLFRNLKYVNAWTILPYTPAC